MDWKKTIADYAPTVGAVFGAPGIAVGTAIRSILNMSDTSTDDEVKAVLATPEGQEKIRLAEIAYKSQVLQADVRREEIVIQDKDSARQREVGTKDKVNRNLAYLIVGAFIGMVIATLAGYSKVDSALAGTLIGYLSAKAEQVISYYFGSTHSSAAKNDIISTMSKK